MSPDLGPIPPSFPTYDVRMPSATSNPSYMHTKLARKFVSMAWKQMHKGKKGKAGKIKVKSHYRSARGSNAIHPIGKGK